MMKSIKRNLAIAPITEIFGTVVGVGMFYWIGQRVFHGEISPGAFVTFFGAVMSVISPVKKLGNVNASIQKALAANERIYEILEAEVTVKEDNNPKHIGDLKNSIEIQLDEFRYISTGELVLKDIHLSIHKGELVAIVGPTGVGEINISKFDS